MAIAGAFGYIGKHFLEAAINLGIPNIYVYDKKPIPQDLDPNDFTSFNSPEEFYSLDVDFWHLALHPQDRALIPKNRRDPNQESPLALLLEKQTLALIEKPMASPETPDECRAILEAVRSSPATFQYDYLGLFDSTTKRVLTYLSSLKNPRIHSINSQVSKPREDPEVERNYIIIVPMPFQEVVHPLSFILQSIGLDALNQGITVSASSLPYNPPNPQDYPYVVDGMCDFSLEIGDIEISGCTNFKDQTPDGQPTPFQKINVIQGVSDNGPFEIVANFQEDGRSLLINGDIQDISSSSSYEQAILTLWDWYNSSSRSELMQGNFPNPSFTFITYQLSSILWSSSFHNQEIKLTSLDEILTFDADFENLSRTFPKY